MREMNMTARECRLTGRIAASTEKSLAERGPANRLAPVAAQMRGKAKPPVLLAVQRGNASQLNPMPWCKHPAASAFGRLCTDQLKAWTRREP